MEHPLLLHGAIGPMDQLEPLACGLQPGISNKLQLKDYTNITSPCLLLLDDRDKMISRDETVAVQRALPNAEFRLLPDIPHAIEQVNTQLICSSIKAFLN